MSEGVLERWITLDTDWKSVTCGFAIVALIVGSNVNIPG